MIPFGFHVGGRALRRCQAANDRVKLVLRARQSSFGTPKLTVRGFDASVHIAVLRRWGFAGGHGCRHRSKMI